KRGAATPSARSRLAATFRHQAKIATARIGDFDRPLYPVIARLVSELISNAAEQTTRRLPTEPQRAAASVPLWSYEAEVRAIVARYVGAIEEARRSGKP